MENLCTIIILSLLLLLLSLPAIAQPPPTPSPSPSVHIPPPPSISVQIPPPPPPSVQIPPPPPPPQQLRNIIDALIGAGDFTSWVTILSLANPLMLPMSTTFFIPQDNNARRNKRSDDGVSIMDPLLFPYHIVPQRLSFSDLLLFKPNTRLPTLLPKMSIVITNNSQSNFTINNIPISHPNLYNTESISVHGISAVLDYSVFGDSFPPKVTTSPTTTMETNNAGNQVSEGILTPPSEGILTTIGDPSDAACSCTEAPIVFLIFCGVLAFKMQRMPFVR